MAPTAEFSRLMTVDPLPDDGFSTTLQASADERARLAARFGLSSIERLEGRLRIGHTAAAGCVRVDGSIQATAAQYCVVTNEPVPATVDVVFERLFSRDAVTDEEEIEIDPLDEAPEPLESDKLDLGEIVAEEFFLALDPYPRAPAADKLVAEDGTVIGIGDGPDGGIFAALTRLKKS